jgi:hypothetical protein
VHAAKSAEEKAEEEAASFSTDLRLASGGATPAMAAAAKVPVPPVPPDEEARLLGVELLLEVIIAKPYTHTHTHT